LVKEEVFLTTKEIYFLFFVCSNVSNENVEHYGRTA